MTINIPNKVYLAVSINGVPIPVVITNTMQVQMHQNVSVSLPTLKIELDDTLNTFNKSLNFNDGAIIEVLMHDNSKKKIEPAVRYRTFGTPTRQKSSSLGVARYTALALLDSPEFIRATPNLAIPGNSLEAMQVIAKKLNFNLISDVSPNDKMVWLPGRATWAKYMQDIIAHAWINDTAFPQATIDEQRNLRYTDITQVFKRKKIVASFLRGDLRPIDTTTPNYIVTEHQSINRSGMFNNWGGVGQRTTQLTSSGAAFKSNAIKATTVNNTIDLSQSSSNKVSANSRMLFVPDDGGNAHPNYIIARHQNFRQMNLYSQNVYVLTDETTVVNMFDLVYFRNTYGSDTDKVDSGLYVVTAKIKVLIGTRYLEKIELCSVGPSNANNDLV